MMPAAHRVIDDGYVEVELADIRRSEFSMLQLDYQSLFNVALMSFAGCGQELKVVRVLGRLLHQLRLTIGQQPLEVRRCCTDPTVKLRHNLMLQNHTGPAILYGRTGVPFAGF